MSKSTSYIITTVSNNLNQRSKPVFSQGINNVISLREKATPYTVLITQNDEETIPKFPLGRNGS